MSGAEFTSNLLAQLTWALSGMVVLLASFAADELWQTPFVTRLRKYMGIGPVPRSVSR